MSNVVERFLALLDGVSESGSGWMARCPAHDDRTPSLHISKGDDGRVLLYCHAGCATEEVVRAAGSTMADLHKEDTARSPSAASTPPSITPTSSPSSVPVAEKRPPESQVREGLTLVEYAEAKQLPEGFLKEMGVCQISHHDKPALRMDYLDETGMVKATRIRIALQGDRFRWRKRSRPILYGLERLPSIRKAKYVILVEGESDAQTLWFHGLPALGVPGASTWKPNWAALLDGLDVYVWQEPDSGGETLVGRLARSVPRTRVLVPLTGIKDVSQVHCQGGDVVALLQDLRARAQSLTDMEEARIKHERARALTAAGELARRPDILSELDTVLKQLGLSGETDNARLIYLALTSRLLDRPVSVVVKGPSSGGKSFLCETVLKTMPNEAYHKYTSMSDKALLYSDVDLKHRFLVVIEGTALKGEMAAYVMRSLLSEGSLDHQTVVKGEDGMVGKHLRVEGPTGLLVTTTSARLDPELETRLFSIEVQDDIKQTRSILRAMAEKTNKPQNEAPDLKAWEALQQWLQMGTHLVVVPYAEWLADNIQRPALRLRRDFWAVLQLIKAHAIVHQKSRLRDEDGRIVADVADYGVVHDLVADIIAESAGVAVLPPLKETVHAVRVHMIGTRSAAQIDDIAQALGLDRSTASRRLRRAWEAGYLQRKRGRRMLYWTGHPMPDGLQVLPSPQMLAAEMVERKARTCSADIACTDAITD